MPNINQHKCKYTLTKTKKIQNQININKKKI